MRSYLTGSFLMALMKVRYSPNHYLLLVLPFLHFNMLSIVLHLYVLMYVCMYIRMYTYTYASMYEVCMYVHERVKVVLYMKWLRLALDVSYSTTGGGGRGRIARFKAHSDSNQEEDG